MDNPWKCVIDYNADTVPLAFEFTNIGSKVGKLWFKEGVLYFEGNANESAERFFETFQNLINQKYAEVCKERDALKLELATLKSRETVAWILTETVYGLDGESWIESTVGTHKFHSDCEPLCLAVEDAPK